MGCDRQQYLPGHCLERFQSTQPEWAATGRAYPHQRPRIISIHAARVGCDRFPVACIYGKCLISIHAARVGCDCVASCMSTSGFIFQSTQPEWAATASDWHSLANTKISIHAARVGCDSIRINCNYYLFYSYKSAKLTFLLN